jgi:hypothetical protein
MTTTERQGQGVPESDPLFVNQIYISGNIQAGQTAAD